MNSNCQGMESVTRIQTWHESQWNGNDEMDHKKSKGRKHPEKFTGTKYLNLAYMFMDSYVTDWCST